MSESNAVVNFMGGNSYTMDPLKTLKLVLTSLIRGESQSYRFSPNSKKFKGSYLFQELYDSTEDTMDTVNYFDDCLQKAIDYDFEGCIELIEPLRHDYGMRLNTQALVSALILHPKRVEFNKTHPTVLRKAILTASHIPTDLCSQFAFLKKSGKPIPSIWKRACADKLEEMSRYHYGKYLHGSKTGSGEKVKEMNKLEKASLVDLIRLTHPRGDKNTTINELVKNGKIEVADEDETWERLKSSGKTWREIIDQIKLPHMALLRNLRNILEEMSIATDQSDVETILSDIFTRLENGVVHGRQFPFRYYSAYLALKESTSISRKHREAGLICLNNCMVKSLDTIPQLNGRVDCLADNSGSAKGAFTSEYGSIAVSTIANLSSLLTCLRATRGGSVWVFGDKLQEYKVNEKPILEQLDEINKIGDGIGQCTENGIWLFFKNAIKNKIIYDTIFIYSDQQAGHGGLYAISSELPEMKELNGTIVDNRFNSQYVDVLKLVNRYREQVKRDINLFSVQVAGYDNSVLPDLLYRGAVLSGWTGKEALLASKMIDIFDKN